MQDFIQLCDSTLNILTEVPFWTEIIKNKYCYSIFWCISRPHSKKSTLTYTLTKTWTVTQLLEKNILYSIIAHWPRLGQSLSCWKKKNYISDSIALNFGYNWTKLASKCVTQSIGIFSAWPLKPRCAPKISIIYQIEAWKNNCSPLTVNTGLTYYTGKYCKWKCKMK